MSSELGKKMKNGLIVWVLFGLLVNGLSAASPRVMLGSDVLAARSFSYLKGKRVGLLTNPSGVNRKGVSTVDLLHRAPNVNLVALFGAEHGVYGTIAAARSFRIRSIARRAYRSFHSTALAQ